MVTRENGDEEILMTEVKMIVSMTNPQSLANEE